MEKIKKWGIFGSLFIFLILLSVQFVWADESNTSDFSYQLNATDGTAIITGYEGSASEIVIPSQIIERGFSYQVKAIGERSFSGNSAIRSVTIENGVETIGRGAFSGCNRLESVKLSDSLIQIGSDAFSGCGLQFIKIPDSVYYIEDRAFQNCTQLSEVQFGVNSSLEEIRDYVFENCNLDKIILPEGLQKLGFGVFNNNPIRKLILPASLVSSGGTLLTNDEQKSVIILGDPQFSNLGSDMGFGDTAEIYGLSGSDAEQLAYSCGYSFFPINAPSNFSAIMQDNKTVTLEWAAVSPVTRYKILRSENGGEYREIATLSGTVYTDENISYENTYKYKIYPIYTDCLNEIVEGKTSEAIARVEIPDSGLYDCLLEVADNGDGILTSAELGKIERIDAQNRKISNIEGIHFCTNLSDLNLSENNILDITRLSELENLKRLDISYNQIENIDPLANMGSLEELDLAGNRLNNITVLSGLPNIQVLYIYDNNIQDISPVINMHNLVTLCAGNNDITDITALSNLTKLQCLYIENNNISNISVLANLKNLEALNVSENQISKLPDLRGLTQLDPSHYGPFDYNWFVLFEGNDISLEDAKDNLPSQLVNNAQWMNRQGFISSIDVKDVFKDVQTGAWFYDYVSWAYKHNLMTGLKSDIFGPAENLARAQFAVILYRMEGEPAVDYQAIFPDISDGSWYTSAVMWASNAGIITGYSSNGHFGPADPITREQIATMLYRYAKYKGYDLTRKNNHLESWIGAEYINDFAWEPMKWAVATGIITGKQDGTGLDPQGNAVRAEIAAMIQRMNNYVIEEDIDNGIFYVGDQKVQLDFPETWQGKVIVEHTEDEAIIYSRANYETIYGGGVHVIERRYEPTNESEYVLIGQHDGMYYYGVKGFYDIQYDYNDKEKTEEYKMLSEGIESLLRDIKFIS